VIRAYRRNILVKNLVNTLLDEPQQGIDTCTKVEWRYDFIELDAISVSL